MKFSLIIPAYDEEKRIGKVIESYLKHYTKKYGNDFELIVVVDGADNTLKICNDYSLEFSRLKIDHSHKPRGKGAAILQGFKLAKGKIIVFTDAYESVNPADFDIFVTITKVPIELSFTIP